MGTVAKMEPGGTDHSGGSFRHGIWGSGAAIGLVTKPQLEPETPLPPMSPAQRIARDTPWGHSLRAVGSILDTQSLFT